MRAETQQRKLLAHVSGKTAWENDRWLIAYGLRCVTTLSRNILYVSAARHPCLVVVLVSPLTLRRVISVAENPIRECSNAALI